MCKYTIQRFIKHEWLLLALLFILTDVLLSGLLSSAHLGGGPWHPDLTFICLNPIKKTSTIINPQSRMCVRVTVVYVNNTSPNWQPLIISNCTNLQSPWPLEVKAPQPQDPEASEVRVNWGFWRARLDVITTFSWSGQVVGRGSTSKCQNFHFGLFSRKTILFWALHGSLLFFTRSFQ